MYVYIYIYIQLTHTHITHTYSQSCLYVREVGKDLGACFAKVTILIISPVEAGDGIVPGPDLKTVAAVILAHNIAMEDGPFLEMIHLFLW